MSVDPFAGVLDPFAQWDIAATYERYSAFFDVVIYCTIFIALSHVVFLRRFPGRAGKALATAIGLALGISLAVAGRQYGFSLRSAGPIAVFLALLLVGFLILYTLLHIHVSWKLAVPLTYVIMYLFLRAMSPSLFGIITQSVPFINLLSVVIFLISVWQVGVILWPRKDGNDQLERGDASFIARLDHKDEEREVKVEKRLAKKMTPQAYRETRRIENNLESVQKEVRSDHPDWRVAAQALSDTCGRLLESKAKGGAEWLQGGNPGRQPVPRPGTPISLPNHSVSVAEGDYCHSTGPGTLLLLTPFGPDRVSATHTA